MEMNSVASRTKDFTNALEQFVKIIKLAIAAYENQNGPGSLFAYQKWKTVALPLLSTDLVDSQKALSQLPSKSALKILVEVSEKELGLGKKMDAFSFDFAGPQYTEQLEQAMNATVLAASNLIESIATTG